MNGPAGWRMRTVATAFTVVLAGTVLGSMAIAAPTLQPVVTQGIADGAPRILVEGGQLLVGPNEIVFEFGTSPRRHVSGVTVLASQAGPAPAAPLALSPDGPSRFHGRIVIALTGSCRLQVNWLEDGGHQSHTFTVPVIVGHH